MHIDKKIIIAVVAVVVIAGAWYALPSTPKAEAPVATEESGATDENTETTETADQPSDLTPAEATTTTASVPVPPPTTPARTTPPTTKTTPAPSKASLPTITYSGNDFLPRKLTVVQGSTVRFYNNSDHDMWVASDIHPLHSAYPEKSKNDCAGSTFDMCRYVSKGQYWDFTFNKAGQWKYHNEDRPVDGGEVVVLDPAEKPSSIPGYQY